MSRFFVIAFTVATVLISSTRGLQCYQCGDLVDVVKADADADPITKGLSGLLGGIANAVMPSCKEFNASDSRYKTDCPLKDGKEMEGCSKNKMGNTEFRGCQEKINKPGCVQQDKMTICYCAGNLCNGAETAALSALFLVLPAALAFLRI